MRQQLQRHWLHPVTFLFCLFFSFQFWSLAHPDNVWPASQASLGLDWIHHLSDRILDRWLFATAFDCLENWKGSKSSSKSEVVFLCGIFFNTESPRLLIFCSHFHWLINWKKIYSPQDERYWGGYEALDSFGTSHEDQLIHRITFYVTVLVDRTTEIYILAAMSDCITGLWLLIWMRVLWHGLTFLIKVLYTFGQYTWSMAIVLNNTLTFTYLYGNIDPKQSLVDTIGCSSAK